MGRPSFPSICIGIAEMISARSTCRRLQVGCVIASPDFRKILSWGYNGNAAGGPNDCDRFGEDAVGSCGCVHAECNAVVNCDVSREREKIVFCTNLPCVACAKLLINMGGVKHVWYAKDYRIRDSLEWFARVRILCEQFKQESTLPDGGFEGSTFP